MSLHDSHSGRLKEKRLKETALSVMHLICSLHVGGAELMLLDLLETWQREKAPLQVTVVVMNNAVDPALKKRLDAITGLTVYYFNRPKSSRSLQYVLNLLRLVSQQNVQLVHTHDRGAKHFSYLLKLFKPHLQLLYTLHEPTIIQQLSWVEKLFQRKWLNCNIAVSQAVQQECATYGIHNNTCVYNGVSLQRFVYQKREFSPSRSLRLICVARFDLSKKGQDILIKAVAMVNQRLAKMPHQAVCKVVCTLAGFDLQPADLQNPACSGSQALKQLAQAEGVEDAMTIVLNETRVETLLQHHDVFVLPSRREGFGLALVEAMAAGLPVVASNLQGPAEIITHGENGLLFEPGNIDSLVSQLLMLIEQPEWIPRLSEAGVQRAMMFSIEKMATTLCKLYYQQVGCYLETAENVTKADQQLKTSRQKEHPHEETAHVP